ncbi:MAG: translation initiation factor [Flavobacteriales bacterium]
MGKEKPKSLNSLESLGALFGTEPSESEEETNIEADFDELDASTFDLRVQLDKKQRKGKAVTLVTGFQDLHVDDLKDLAKRLKSKCGVGGGAKDQQIIIQGDHVVKVMDLLKEEGFRVKRSGG